MLFIRKDDGLANNEEVVLQQYTHWWIFVVPIMILLFGFYLWLKAVSKGSFSLYSLLMIDEPKTVANTISYQIQSYIYQLSILIKNNMPNVIYEFLSQTRLHPRKWLSQIIIFYALYRLIRATLTFITTQLVVTNQRVMIRTGLFKPQIVEFPRMHIDAFHIKKGLLSQFLDVGTLIIQASGGLTAKLPAIKAPEELTTHVIESDDYDVNTR
ncbi:PH domain-containing protein [Wohlfahrtiimonas larvae]|uniref:YdbS-like PH domain-containing protein n=1 Tax=Wohlfahrtiimonas larvae TaxID=1157986 RepID=A0ABP9ME70_9GAMM|nr:PH domain-containing protein [Wohlfahrtiimonas larvae]